MKKAGYMILVVLVAALAVRVTATTAPAEEPTSLTAGNIKVLLDNDRLRVVEAIRPPGTIEPMHTHPPYLAYFFGPWKGRFTSPDGKITEKEFPGGKLLWFPEGKTHAVEIIGTTDQHVLVIELKK